MLVCDPPTTLQQHLIAGVAYLPAGSFEPVYEVTANHVAVEDTPNIVPGPVRTLVGVRVRPTVNGELDPTWHRLPETVRTFAGDSKYRAAKKGIEGLELPKTIEPMRRFLEVIEVKCHLATSSRSFRA